MLASLVDGLSEADLEALCCDWPLWARPRQLPPQGDWTTWLILGGRGSGKTRAGAEWVRAQATGDKPVSPIALVGETMAEVRAIMIEGDSGLLRIHPRADRPRLVGGKLIWPNGVEGIILSASDPDRFRGPQFAAAWADEVAKWPDAQAAWDMLQFGLRLGTRPRQVATTTPRPGKFLRRLMADSQTATVRMRTDENKANLAPGFLSAIVARYRGTVLGRQELEGELIEDRPDALWTRAMLEAARLAEPSPLERIVVAVDPPVTGTARADACGIVVAGLRGDEAVVLADRTVQGVPPLAWARRVVASFESFAADAVVAEVNQGGDLVASVIGQVDANVPVKPVRANRGKWLRAEPVAALYAQGRVKHMAGLTELEDEMCGFGADGLVGGRSPDRVDALVWALTELLLGQGRPRVRQV